MPLYEYRCSKCGKKFELIRKFSDVPLTIHEGCGGQVEQLISAPAFHLKGHGWYATDYTKEAKTSESKDGKPEENRKESQKESRTDRPIRKWIRNRRRPHRSRIHNRPMLQR